MFSQFRQNPGLKGKNVSKLVDQSIKALKIMAPTGKVHPQIVPDFLEAGHRSLVTMVASEATPTIEPPVDKSEEPEAEATTRLRE